MQLHLQSKQNTKTNMASHCMYLSVYGVHMLVKIIHEIASACPSA